MATKDPRLLIVDDNEEIRDIVSRKLRKRGYEVLVAEDGERALAIAAQEPLDLVILDIMMPGIDGTEVLRRLRKTYTPADLPIIMASAKSDTEDIVLTAELGANDHVAKPFDHAILLAKIKALMRLKEATAAHRPHVQEPTPGEVRAGAIISGGRYRLGKTIGAGTFGTVYQARHLNLDLEVAIKVLRPGVMAESTSLERFRREGVAACRVRHPNAVTVTDFGVTETGVAFLVMELLDGRSLSRELRSKGKLSPSRANAIVQPICDVLAEAHSQRIVHRDVKPDNVFLHRAYREEIVKVLDFGIAKLRSDAGRTANLTGNWILGTPAYMSPERIADEDYDGRADIYSLGVVLFEILTGRKPFQDANPTVLMTKHLREAPPKLRTVAPDLSAELEKAIAWALEKAPRDRPDAEQFAEAVARGVGKSASEAQDSSAGTADEDDDFDTPTLALDPTSAEEQR